MQTYVETYRGYDVFRDVDPVRGLVWHAVSEFPGLADDEAGVVAYVSRTAVRAAIDATYEPPGGAS